MKRALIMVMAAVFGAGVLGAGATFALFNASAGAQENPFTAGTVSLFGYRADGDTIDGPMFYITAAAGANQNGQDGMLETGLWAPGDSVTRSFQIENTGTLDAKLMTLTTTYSGDAELAQLLRVQVCEDRDCVSSVFFDKTMAELASAPHPFTPPVELQAGAVPWTGDLITLFFKVTLPLSAGDTLQDKTGQAGFQVYAEQVKNNP